MSGERPISADVVVNGMRPVSTEVTVSGMRPVSADVVVIGAGPGGLSAATAAARAGASVHLIDAGAAAGGQYWMQGSAGPRPSRQHAEGSAAIDAARDAGVHFHLGTEVWAIFPADGTRDPGAPVNAGDTAHSGYRHIHAAQGDRPVEFLARTIVIASGAHDRVAPFPGWTLPGVMTAGAAQRLAKLDGIAPGRRVVVAGSGPFLLAVAAAVAHAGAEIAAVVEAQPPSLALASLLARHPERWREAAGLLRASSTGRTQRRFGWVATEALGDQRVEAVRIAPLTRTGSGPQTRTGGTETGTATIDHSRTQTIRGIDALVIGWGFRPSIELTALLRCRHAFDDARGGWFCEADPRTGQTSVAGIFAVGEVTGVAGARPAQLAGALAGRAAATHAGCAPLLAPSSSAATQARRLSRARAFAAGLNAIFTPPPAIHRLAAPDTIICRCEEVTHGDILAAADDGALTVPGVKRLTRAGMGICQGRICGWSIANTCAQAGSSPVQAGFNAPHIPIRPVPLALIARALGEGPEISEAPNT